MLCNDSSCSVCCLKDCFKNSINGKSFYNYYKYIEINKNDLLTSDEIIFHIKCRNHIITELKKECECENKCNNENILKDTFCNICKYFNYFIRSSKENSNYHNRSNTSLSGFELLNQLNPNKIYLSISKNICYNCFSICGIYSNQLICSICYNQSYSLKFKKLGNVYQKRLKDLRYLLSYYTNNEWKYFTEICIIKNNKTKFNIINEIFQDYTSFNNSFYEEIIKEFYDKKKNPEAIDAMFYCKNLNIIIILEIDGQNCHSNISIEEDVKRSERWLRLFERYNFNVLSYRLGHKDHQELLFSDTLKIVLLSQQLLKDILNIYKNDKNRYCGMILLYGENINRQIKWIEFWKKNTFYPIIHLLDYTDLSEFPTLKFIFNNITYDQKKYFLKNSIHLVYENNINIETNANYDFTIPSIPTNFNFINHQICLGNDIVNIIKIENNKVFLTKDKIIFYSPFIYHAIIHFIEYLKDKSFSITNDDKNYEIIEKKDGYLYLNCIYKIQEKHISLFHFEKEKNIQEIIIEKNTISKKRKINSNINQKEKKKIINYDLILTNHKTKTYKCNHNQCQNVKIFERLCNAIDHYKQKHLKGTNINEDKIKYIIKNNLIITEKK